MPTLKELMDTLPQRGSVQWIGVRPARNAPVEVIARTTIVANHGLTNDHYANTGGSRQVTLIQAEHLDAVASILGVATVDPSAVRRNIVVRGINLLALKNRQFFVGEALLEFTGLCHPCSRMEKTLGPGGYNALRGHGGITARVLKSGDLKIGDAVGVI